MSLHGVFRLKMLNSLGSVDDRKDVFMLRLVWANLCRLWSDQRTLLQSCTVLANFSSIRLSLGFFKVQGL